MLDPTFDFDKMLCFSLYATANAMVRDYAEPLKQQGITYPQLLVMAGLWNKDDVSISTLSELTLFDLGTLTPIVRRLANNGFITVYLDPEDRRRRNVLLTDKGRALKAEAAKVFNNMACKIELEESQVQQVLDVCQRIRSRLR
ncbi:MarR family winged helix-turn-helix transcriptional regulator [Pseudomonas alkylphenolica]|uniref:MarR family winged helix-turn-helix transcriptional regulator n=1 Tax=Pseudomonas alkylphenolica TaxID=237609 RepID=UPI0018D6F1ED|nr:MarR family transcriptional regulator [Pseudomonas alkylphenolica]MBH3428405.1 MarR family transcriptional regulator [Pseudomonas alkylphenolica]